VPRKKKKEVSHYYKRGVCSTPIYHDVWDSPAFRVLSLKARCLLLELQKLEFPNRNGRIGLSETNAAKLLGCSANTASVAFEELLEVGFIQRSFDGDYSIGRASEWAITYLPVNGREATHDWKNYAPKKQKVGHKN
tara:strand:- start:755 stop:1162 length:408 start_codon:yes stop_codon:yes gene_type:complete